MSESEQHQKLVKMIIEYIKNAVGNSVSCFIEADAAYGYSIPQLTQEGFRPDVIFSFENMLFVGEAKTRNDVCRAHSIMQYESYIRKCAIFQGNATFVLAVPWMEYATAYNILKKIEKNNPGTYSIIILKGIGI